MFGTVTQNVFGGGFQGHSYMDSYIYFGTPAVELLEPQSYRPVGLIVGSIYGGGYYDTTGSGGYPELLHGDSTIQRGSGSISGSYVFNGYSNVGGSNQIAVTGDVFGQGSFSTISGSATVWTDGYRQETQDKDRMVMSFQGIDELRFIDSIVSINGSAQGGNTTLTEMMALNDIGHLILQGSSEIILHSEMNQVSEYSSYVTDGVPSNEADFIDGRCGNTIRLIDGAVALILGPSNLGPSLGNASDRTGMVEGFTLIEREVGEDYYGAFATASKYTGNDSGFLVLEGGEYVAASVLVEKNMKVWYIAGATTIERTLTFNKSNYSASVGLNIPRILGTTELRYTGAYIDYNIQDSMYVAYPWKEGVHEPVEPYFTMLLRDNSKNVDPIWSVNVATHEFEGGWNVVSTDAGTVKDSSIVISSQFHGNMTISGLLGYVIIHIEEVSSYGSVDVPVHTVDMRIGIYIEPIFDPNINPDSNTIRMTVVEGKATGYLSLPALGNIYSYRVSGFSSTTLALNSFVLSADTTYFGRSGWESSPYMAGDGLIPNDGTSVIFGTGGAISPVIRIDYNGDAIGNEAKTISFIVTADPVNGIGSEYVCEITVELVDSKPVQINLHYSGIGTDSGNSYTLSATTEGSATVLQWSDAGSGLELPFGTSIRDHAGSFIVRWIDENGESKIQVCSNLGEALQVLVDSINPVKVLIEGEYETFDYGEFFSGWYTDSRMINQFNLGSPVSQNIDLYAKFGVTVIFDFGNNEPVNQMVLPAGTTLHDNKVFNFKEGEFDENGNFWMYTEEGMIEVDEASVIGKSYLDNSTSYAGHYLISINGWVLDVDNPTQAYDFGSPLLESKTLYLVWEVESYTIEITVEEDADSTEFENGDFSASGTEVQYSNGKIIFTAQYGSNISFTFLNGFHAVSVGSNDALSISNTGKTVGLVIRDAGENNAKVTITMTVSDAMDITFQFKVEDGYTSDLDGNTLTVTASDKKLTFIKECDQTISSVKIGTQIQFDMTGEYDIYFWVNGILKTEYTVNSDDVNPEIIVMVVKKVDILPFYNTGISGLNLYQVVVPSNLASGWAHSDTVINIDVAGSSVHENDYFSIVPDAGYYVPEGYVPHNTDRTVIGGGVYFTVNGSGDVSFDILAATTGSFTLSITVFGSDGVKAEDISSLKGWSILFTFDGHTVTIMISESEDGSYLNPIVGTISYNAQSSVHSYSCSMNGFEFVDGTLTQVGERLELELHPLTYHVNFHHLDGKVTRVQWDVLSVLSVPEKFVTATSRGCPLIVELINGDVPVRFLDTNVMGTVTVSYSDFDTSREMDVSAISPLQSELPPSDGTAVETIIILSSEAVAGNVIQVGLLFNKDVTFHVPVADGQVTVVFSASNQTLTIGGDIGGTGLFLASADGFQLWIYVMSDPEAVQ